MDGFVVDDADSAAASSSDPPIPPEQSHMPMEGRVLPRRRNHRVIVSDSEDDDGSTGSSTEEGDSDSGKSDEQNARSATSAQSTSDDDSTDESEERDAQGSVEGGITPPQHDGNGSHYDESEEDFAENFRCEPQSTSRYRVPDAGYLMPTTDSSLSRAKFPIDCRTLHWANCHPSEAFSHDRCENAHNHKSRCHDWMRCTTSEDLYHPTASSLQQDGRSTLPCNSSLSRRSQYNLPSWRKQGESGTPTGQTIGLTGSSPGLRTIGSGATPGGVLLYANSPYNSSNAVPSAYGRRAFLQ